jgi:hypothetical protein
MFLPLLTDKDWEEHALMDTRLQWINRRSNAGSSLNAEPRRNPQQPERPRIPSTPLDDVRWEKVLSLRAAIACGRYHIASEFLAEKLLLEVQRSASTRWSFDRTKRPR